MGAAHTLRRLWVLLTRCVVYGCCSHTALFVGAWALLSRCIVCGRCSHSVLFLSSHAASCVGAAHTVLFLSTAHTLHRLWALLTHCLVGGADADPDCISAFLLCAPSPKLPKAEAQLPSAHTRFYTSVHRPFLIPPPSKVSPPPRTQHTYHKHGRLVLLNVTAKDMMSNRSTSRTTAADHQLTLSNRRGNRPATLASAVDPTPASDIAPPLPVCPGRAFYLHEQNMGGVICSTTNPPVAVCARMGEASCATLKIPLWPSATRNPPVAFYPRNPPPKPHHTLPAPPYLSYTNAATSGPTLFKSLRMLANLWVPLMGFTTMLLARRSSSLKATDCKAMDSRGGGVCCARQASA